MARKSPPKKNTASRRKRPAPKHVRAPSASQPARDVLAEKQRVQRNAVLLFSAAALMTCLILIPGDHVWLWFHSVLLGLFGHCAILWPILLFYISISGALEKQTSRARGKMALMVAVILLFCAAVYAFSVPSAAPADSKLSPAAFYFSRLKTLYTEGVGHAGSGLFGGLLGIPVVAGLGLLGGRIVLVLALFAAVMILTGTGLIQLFRALTKPANVVASNIGLARERRIEQNREEAEIDVPLDGDSLPMHPVCSPGKKKAKPKKSEKLNRLEKVFNIGGEPSEPAKDAPKAENPPKPADDLPKADPVPDVPAPAEPVPPREQKKVPLPVLPPESPPGDGSYHFPPVSMLATTKGPGEQDVISEVQTNGRRLVDTLNSFGVRTSFVGYSRGPAVTRYELQPAAGVKISKITNLSDDLSMNLATAGIRIEAPIPGKAAVGIEVPNKKNTVVRMRELVESNSFAAAKSRLTVALGRDIAGEVAVADLDKMPHLLIAGATGSGKSVCINSMIISLLYKSTPDEVRLLMIDPKVVELGIYNGIPQLLVPVVTDPRKAAGALSWAVTEMLKRYKTFAANSVRDLKAYNALAASRDFKDENGQPMERMPQIVIIIDELADLMMVAPNDVEDSICRLAQMARAAGMHLVIATQRPSVDVITGIIKANIPSRIAFAVSSQVDSRTILDMGGAEKLLGRGDMLFSPVGSQKPKRIQGCFVSDSEIESVVGFVKKSQEADYSKAIAEEIDKNAAEENKKSSGASVPGDDTDPMLPEAVKCVVDCGQASTSLLQRRLRLGYARAGRLVDQMEQMGIVGPHEGSKPRQVLITYQQWLEMNMRQSDEAAGHEEKDS
ncbi:MAG: DNA translocase FtsK [Oscillospiraceae bacterium]|nr:DNA translocase FtsK [Oscillospiraceae bacterium]